VTRRRTLSVRTARRPWGDTTERGGSESVLPRSRAQDFGAALVQPHDYGAWSQRSAHASAVPIMFVNSARQLGERVRFFSARAASLAVRRTALLSLMTSPRFLDPSGCSATNRSKSRAFSTRWARADGTRASWQRETAGAAAASRALASQLRGQLGPVTSATAPWSPHT